MTTHADFEDFFRSLNEHGVEYMIVGGYAVAYHGYPRFTKDIDVFYGNTRVNTQRLQAALAAFGFQASSIPLEVIEKPNAVLSIGLEPVRIDLLNAIAGVLFEEAWPNVVAGRYGDTKVSFIGKEDLLRNKRSTGRQRDLGDVEELS
jgi:predicted nucleotidyltransferase